jgi:hypothetical protein
MRLLAQMLEQVALEGQEEVGLRLHVATLAAPQSLVPLEPVVLRAQTLEQVAVEVDL